MPRIIKRRSYRISRRKDEPYIHFMKTYKYNYFYKITNTLNNHFYYGVHSTDNIDDGYMKVKIDNNYKYYNFKFEEKDIKTILKNNKIYLNKKDGKFGFVDSKGNEIVECKYDDATELNKYGFAAVKKDGLWGSIDKDGNIIIEPKYNLDENLRIDFIGKWHLGMDLNMNYYCDK